MSIPYLHILIRVEDDGSLHAMGAFTTKEKQAAYTKASGLKDNQVRHDFYNGPFDSAIPVIYAGHRRWNMDRFQLAGYFKSEEAAWTSVTQEGYVAILRIDTLYEEEQALEKEALDRYAKLRKRWRLSSYESLVDREGEEKARANIVLRFYEDALESLKPETQRNVRALYGLILLLWILPLAFYLFLSRSPDYGENLKTVGWLPDYATDVSYYRSKQVLVYEFSVSQEDFKCWAEDRGMSVQRLVAAETLSRYKAYLSAEEDENTDKAVEEPTLDDIGLAQDPSRIRIDSGFFAQGGGKTPAVAAYDLATHKAYYEQLPPFRPSTH